MFLSGAGCDSYNILPSPGECHLLLMSPFAGKASLQVQHGAPTPKACVLLLCEAQQPVLSNPCPGTCSSMCFSLSLLMIAPAHMLCNSEEAAASSTLHPWGEATGYCPLSLMEIKCFHCWEDYGKRGSNSHLSCVLWQEQSEILMKDSVTWSKAFPRWNIIFRRPWLIFSPLLLLFWTQLSRRLSEMEIH